MFPGTHCEKLGLSGNLLIQGQIEPAADPITNGLAVELNKFANKTKLSTKTLTEWLCKLQPKLKTVKESTLRMTLKRAVDTQKKYERKKTVSKFNSLEEFLNSTFIHLAPSVDSNQSSTNSIPLETATTNQQSPKSPGPTCEVSVPPEIETRRTPNQQSAKSPGPTYKISVPPEIETRNIHPCEIQYCNQSSTNAIPLQTETPNQQSAKSPGPTCEVSVPPEIETRKTPNQQSAKSPGPTCEISVPPEIETRKTPNQQSAKSPGPTCEISVPPEIETRKTPNQQSAKSPGPTCEISVPPEIETRKTPNQQSAKSPGPTCEISVPPEIETRNTHTCEIQEFPESYKVQVTPPVLSKHSRPERNVEEKKLHNSLHYEIMKEQKKLKSLGTLIETEHDKLRQLKSRQGHYSVRNVEKRDSRAVKMRQELRDAKSTIMKQNSLVRDYEKKFQKLKESNRRLKNGLKFCSDDQNNVRKSILNSEEHVHQLMLENENLRKKIIEQNANNSKKNRSSSYFKRCLNKIRTGVKQNERVMQLNTMIKDKEEEIEHLQTHIEIIQEKLNDDVATKKADGSFNDSVRLCVIELAGLEVAVEKISKVISAVSHHIFSRNLSVTNLPSDTTIQTIVDEGHYLAKLLIATKIALCESFGISRDGTSRKKQKLLDTTVTLDTGEVISLGFTRVAHETAKTINAVTKGHFQEMSGLQNDATQEDFIKSSLKKLSFSMSDRASNEKAADKLLDDWRESALKDQEIQEDQIKVKHFHCMAHVLLGLHKYACDDVKSLEKEFAEAEGPLGRDSLVQFKFWSKGGTVIERVVRTVSDTFAPAGDYRGVRDRWEAHCSENGVKSVIGNYKDNRFNGIFQTAAEILHHADDMINVLDTVKTPNMKLASVKADLQCENIRLLLQCFALFYIRVTGPYWDLITSSDVPYLKLFAHIQNLHKYLTILCKNPDKILDANLTWEHNTTDVPNANLFKNIGQDSQKVDKLLQIVNVVSRAMIRCIEKQLNDFLPGGQFSTAPNENDLRRTDFAQSTNLGCEHHFGDLDSSQKRRPNASIHHHSTIQLLKRNRNPLIKWLHNMSPSERSETMKRARKGGKLMRKNHRDAEKEVLKEIHTEMLQEKDKKSKKRKRNAVCEDDSDNFNEFETNFPNDFSANEYVVVAYQEGWYPGIIEDVHDKELLVNFLSKTRRPGHYVWPQRKDVQKVATEFVIKRGFIPECQNYGRSWFIKEHVEIQSSFEKYCKIYF